MALSENLLFHFPIFRKFYPEVNLFWFKCFTILILLLFREASEGFSELHKK